MEGCHLYSTDWSWCLFIRVLLLLLIAQGNADLAASSCQLRGTRWTEEKPYSACLTTDWQALALKDSYANKNESYFGVLGEAYGSISFGHVLSLHLKGVIKDMPQLDFDHSISMRQTEYAFLQLGNPIVDSIYAASGIIDAPFGLDHRVHRFSLPGRTDKLWPHSVRGSRGSIRWRDDLLLEFGAHQNQRSDLESQQQQIISGRLVQNIDLLHGTRLIGSYLSSADYMEREVGLATLVHNEGNRTSLEWVRKTSAASDQSFEQVFRFVHEQQEDTWLWNLTMEELSQDSYIIKYGAQKAWTESFSGLVCLQYQRERIEPSHKHLTLLLGIDYQEAKSWEGVKL